MTEEQMEQIMKRDQEKAEQEDLLFYSCRTTKDYTAYVKKRLKNYRAEEGEQVLRLSETLNKLMDEVEGHLKRLLKDEERFYYSTYRAVNNAEKDKNGEGKLTVFEGWIDIKGRDVDEEGEVILDGATLEVILKESDNDLQRGFFSIEVYDEDGAVGPFNSTKDAAIYLVNLVYFKNSPRINEHESHDGYGLNPTYH